MCNGQGGSGSQCRAINKHIECAVTDAIVTVMSEELSNFGLSDRVLSEQECLLIAGHVLQLAEDALEARRRAEAGGSANRRSQKMQNRNFAPIAGDGGASLFKLRAGPDGVDSRYWRPISRRDDTAGRVDDGQPVIGVHGGSDIAKSVCGAMLGVHVEK